MCHNDTGYITRLLHQHAAHRVLAREVLVPSVHVVAARQSNSTQHVNSHLALRQVVQLVERLVDRRQHVCGRGSADKPKRGPLGVVGMRRRWQVTASTAVRCPTHIGQQTGGGRRACEGPAQPQSCGRSRLPGSVSHARVGRRRTRLIAAGCRLPPNAVQETHPRRSSASPFLATHRDPQSCRTCPLFVSSPVRAFSCCLQ